MNHGLKHYLHKKADEMNLHLTIRGDEITLHSAKPSQYTKILDILVTVGYPPKSRLHNRDLNGFIFDVLTI